MTNRIEEVKKIIESHRSTYEFGNPPVTHGRFSDNDVELSAQQIDEYYSQLFPQPLDDKELREQAKLTDEDLERVLADRHTHDYTHHLVANAATDKVLALLPSIEEARRQERERIIGIVVRELESRKVIVHTHPLHGGDYCQMCLFVKAIRQP